MGKRVVADFFSMMLEYFGQIAGAISNGYLKSIFQFAFASLFLGIIFAVLSYVPDKKENVELPLNLPTKNQKYISKKENISSQVTKERIEGLKGEIAALRREADKQWTFIQ